MMTDVLFAARKSILATAAPVDSATAALVLVISPRTAQIKCPHQELPSIAIDHTPTHIIITMAETDHSPSITDTAKGPILTGQDHTINLNMTEAPVPIRDTYPTLFPTTAVACNIHPQTDTLEDTLTGTSYTAIDATHP